jgi:hypothetical protein
MDTMARQICVAVMVCLLAGGCRLLQPEPIAVVRNNLQAPIMKPGDAMLEVGKPRPIIDAIGWCVGIPSKVLLWNRKVENHSISQETQDQLAEYMASNGLEQVKVRVNQYRPGDDWRRLTRNTSIAWPWRYTFGAVATLGETLLPGRIFGGDHYNPYTATIHLYTDVPSLALHEAAHAKDFSNRRYPGTYGALYVIPLVSLWHERVATNDVLSYVEERRDANMRREAYRILYPAYGTYGGDALGYVVPKYYYPLYFGGVLVGHSAGRWKASQVTD